MCGLVLLSSEYLHEAAGLNTASVVHFESVLLQEIKPVNPCSPVYGLLL